MISSSTRYEFPLTKRSRLILKLFSLFEEIEQLQHYDNVYAFRRSLVCIVDILLLIERVEIKMELAKEAEKFNHLSSNTEGIAQLKSSIQGLLATPGKIGEDLRNDAIFSILQKRLLLPGGACAFDMPLLHTWLSMPHEQRLAELKQLYAPLWPLHKALFALIDTYRREIQFQKIEVKAGLTHISPRISTSIITLDLSPLSYHLVPEVSLSPKAVFIKFWRHDSITNKAEAFDGQFLLPLGEC